MSWDPKMHWYMRFCVFGWVVNSAVRPSQKRKRWKRSSTTIQTHTKCLIIESFLVGDFFQSCNHLISQNEYKDITL